MIGDLKLRRDRSVQIDALFLGLERQQKCISDWQVAAIHG